MQVIVSVTRHVGYSNILLVDVVVAVVVTDRLRIHLSIILSPPKVCELL